MLLAYLKRPRYYIPLALLVILAVTSAVVFHPAFQKKMLLKHVGPLVDSLQVEYIHFTPWSLQLDKLAVDYAGGHFALESGSIRYCLSSLFLLTANVKSITLTDLLVDISEFSPPETEQPETDSLFPGVLASLQYGVGYALGSAAVNANVVLPEQQSVTAILDGGGVRPKETGTLNLKVDYDTGKEGELVSMDADLVLKQLSRGRFEAIELLLETEAMLAGLPEPETATLKLLVTPAPFGEAELLAFQEAEQEPAYTPESLDLGIVQHDSEGMMRSDLSLQGRYDGNSGNFVGSYRVTANERLVQRYIKEPVIPPAEEVLSGDLRFNLADTTGDITVVSDLLVDQIRETHANENLPGVLRLENNFRLSLLPGLRLRLEAIDSGLTDEAATQPLSSSLPGDLDIPLRDVESFLHQEQILLAFQLPEVPLDWFDIFLPDHNIVDGILTAAFEIATDSDGSIHLNPVQPLVVTGFTLSQDDVPVVENVGLKVMPRVSYHGDALDVWLDTLRVTSAQNEVISGDLSASMPLADTPGAVNVKTNAEVQMHRLVEMLAIEQGDKQSLPEQLSLDLQAALLQQPQRLTVNALDGNILLDNKTRLLHMELQQPLVMEITEAGSRIINSEGQLATLGISEIQLGWFSAFVPDTTLKGRLHSADLSLAAAGQGVMTLTSARPVKLQHVTITGPDGAMLKDVGISVMPSVRLSGDGAQISYRDLAVTGQSRQLLAGNGAVTLPAGEEKPLHADGQLDVDVQALSTQPLVARALQGDVESPVRLEASYKLAQGTAGIDLERLSANLFYEDKQPRVSLTADSRVRIRTRLGSRQSELERARGKVTLAVSNLTPDPFIGILAANGLMFTEANGRAVLSSDGKSLRIDTIEPFVAKGVKVGAAGKPVLDSFTLVTDTETVMQGAALHAKLKQLDVTFDKRPEQPAIRATVDVRLKGQGAATWVEDLTANANVQLPALLDQPGLLPGHRLTAGEMTAVARMDSTGRLESTARVQGLKSNKELPLELLELQLNGQLDENGSFDVQAPLLTRGKSGETDLHIKARHVSKKGEYNDLVGSIDSSVFYLNDILNTLNAISNEQAVREAEAELSEEEQAAIRAEKKARRERPDAQAFWDVIPYNRHATYNIQRLFYTDYLEIVDISGRAEITPSRLSIDELKAHFHDSPVELNAVLNFTPGENPYDLDMQLNVEEFDLATFQRELDPDAIPPAEGLFNVKVDAFGRSPNMVQYRNNLFFDMSLQSSNGVFRLLDPNDPLVVGSSTLAGAVGEGVSYVPTGLFGLGAVARLVKYIDEVPYDRIDAHLVRGESRDVEIRKYVVQSPEILMTARGGITYEEGVDILESPLAMDAQLNLRELGAAIFYDLDLLQDKQDKYGYWVGPEIKFWGTLAVAESNLNEIIEQAGKGAVLGGLTRPISGLIGNIRHRWMDEEGEPIEYTGEDVEFTSAPATLEAESETDEQKEDKYTLPDYYE